VKAIVAGLGAIGGPVAGRLAAAGALAAAFDPWREHVERINERGLVARGARGEQLLPMQATLWEPGTPLHEQRSVAPEVAFICVKAVATDDAIRLVAETTTPDTVIVSLQNGLSEERLVDVFGDRVVGAVTETGGYLAGPGEVVETRADGGFVVGELDGRQSARLDTVKSILENCAPVSISDNIIGDLWSKLTWNCMMNALCGATTLGQGEIITSSETRRLALAVGRETGRVATAAGVALEPLRFLGVDLPALVGDDPAASRLAERHVIDLYSRQMGKGTSMSSDIAGGRRTEVEALNGFVVRKAAALGLRAHCNAAIVQIVNQIDAHERQPGPDVIADLVEALKESLRQ
jgi:2-dehydropantoate 2-reductase